MKDAYRCYAAMDDRGRWRAWRFGPATPEVQARHVDEAARAGHVAFASVQRFAPPQDAGGTVRWRRVRQQYHGPGALPHRAPLYFDVDAGDLEQAFVWTRTLVEFFTANLELPAPAVRVWFSGSKGAHILVDPTALGVQADPALTLDLKAVALELAGHLAADGAEDVRIDPAVYSLPRMLRLPDQVNPKTGLYKIELRHEELLRETAQQLADRARQPRGRLWSPAELPGSPIPAAARWWAGALARARRPREFRMRTAQVAGCKVRPDGYVADELLDQAMPSCIEGLLAATPQPGARNRCELQIACWAKAAKHSQARALSLLAEWTRRTRPELAPPNAEAKAASIVRSVYAGPAYDFSCTAARAAARAVGVAPDCDACQAVRRRDPRRLHSLRLHHDRQWSPPRRISLEEGRALVARELDQRIAAAQAAGADHGAGRQRQDPRGPAGAGPPRDPGGVRGAHPRVGDAGSGGSRSAERHDALLAAGA